jgi:hypothetical protein
MGIFNRNKQQKRSPQIRPASRDITTNNYYRSPRVNTRTVITEDQNRKQDKKRLSVSTVINLVLMGGAVGLVVFATTLTTNPVVDLRKNDASYYGALVYQKAAEDIMSGNVLYRSKLLFPEISFEQALKNKFPEIAQARPVVPLGGRNLLVVITVSEPFAYVSSGSDTGIINSEGVLVVKNSQSVPEDLLKLRFTVPQSNFDIGSRILTSSEVELLKLLESEMNTLEFTDKSNASIRDVLFNVADGQLEARLKSKPFFIKLSSISEGTLQVGGAKATLRQLDRENKLPTQYIDVRVPGRVFVL